MITVCILNELVEKNAYTPTHSEAVNIVDYPMTFFTLEERCVNTEGQPIQCHQLQEVQNGDVLITKSTHTLFYRHGHAGLVVDAEAGLVLEASGYGFHSSLESLEKWNEYPTVKVLRLKNQTKEQINQLIESALTHLVDLPYRLITSKNNMVSTHCSDIIWKAFQAIGLDIDSDGGWLVTPKDISQSPYFEEIESYGFSSTRVW